MGFHGKNSLAPLNFDKTTASCFHSFFFFYYTIWNFKGLIAERIFFLRNEVDDDDRK